MMVSLEYITNFILTPIQIYQILNSVHEKDNIIFMPTPTPPTK